MNRIFKIARREYIATVMTKTFLIGVVFAPVIFGAIFLFAAKMGQARPTTRAPLKVAFCDLSNQLSSEIEAGFQKNNQSSNSRKIDFTALAADGNDFEKTKARVKELLRNGSIDAFVVLDPNIIDDGRMYIYTCNLKPSDIESVSQLEYLFKDVVRTSRFQKQKLDQQLYAKLNSVATEQVDIGFSEGGEKKQSEMDRITKMMLPFAFMYLMFIGVFANGQQMLTSVIEEKSSRIIEVLLSAVTPFELMAGKILGLALAGFTIVVIWGGTAYLAAQTKNIPVALSPQMIIYFIIFFILGYLLISSIMAAAGSVFNSLKDAHNLMLPMSMLFIIPIASWNTIVQDPQGMYARVLSFIPLFSPMVMVLRLSAGAGVNILEITASIIVLFLSLVVTVWLAAKIFRTGILMYGKRPSIREIARWIRQK